MRSLVISSGGLDSTAIALLKRQQGYEVGLVTFDYGQKARREIQAAQALSKRLHCPWQLFNVTALKSIFGTSNQLTNVAVAIEGHYAPSVVVPLRNALFLQVAYIYALTQGYDEIVLGSHLSDVTLDARGEPMYPDCSPEFHQAFETAMLAGLRSTDQPVRVTSASREELTKAALLQQAYASDPAALYGSWSCYASGILQCGVCESCRNRQAAFAAAGLPDLTQYSRCAIIETVPNVNRLDFVRYTPPVRAVCSIVKEPFSGTATIEYYPQEQLLEYVSLDHFLLQLGQEELLAEDLPSIILDALLNVLGEIPLQVTVEIETAVHAPVLARAASAAWQPGVTAL